MEMWPTDSGQSRHRGATGLSASLGLPLTFVPRLPGDRVARAARQRRPHGYAKGLRRISAREAAGLPGILWGDA